MTPASRIPFRRLPLAALLLTLCATTAIAQTPPAEAPAGNAAGRPAEAAAAEPKSYDKVITAEARTAAGLFKVHTLKSRLYFEIPKAMLGQQLLMVANATGVPSDADHVGKMMNREVVRFVLKGNKVYFQSVDHAFTTDAARPNAAAVQAAQRDPILAAFNVEAFGPDGAPVIEVTRLFAGEIGDFGARRLVQGTSLDGNRSYVEGSRAFPGSLRVDAVHTYAAPAMVNTPLGPQKAPAGWPARAATVNLAYNIVKLPEQPMMPRLMDDRVGYFFHTRVDYGSDRQGVERERMIARWRLEKKDPGAAVSEPVKPIVWYIDASTPSALVPYVKKGIEAWNVAFEAAGFRNAVQARPFPSKEEDPEFDPEDVRYSIIRWVPSPVPNAYGPHLSDPRSGEILNANIVMYHNIQRVLRDWYITQAGAVDPRAQQLPLPADLMGDLVAYVVTHEVGHSLGFQHNMKASSQYPFEKLRDPQWLKDMGHVSSIMDYSRMNYLVQPEDKIDPALLIPKVGPYDIFATRWGYTPIPGARTPAQEKPQLETWVREQDASPWLRFQSPKAQGDYGTVMEAVGDADAVRATRLGTKNLQRLVKLLPRMTLRAGEGDRDLDELYKGVWTQWNRELSHVVALVGGYDFHNKQGLQPGPISQPAPAAQQAKAVALLNELLFATPEWTLEPAVIERMPPQAGSLLMLASQRGVLASLLATDRLGRLQAQELAAQAAAGKGASAYRVEQLLADLRAGVLGELRSGAAPTVPRRNLQRAYVGLLSAKLSEASAVDDGRAAVRVELKDLRSQFKARSQNATDAKARAHWADLADMSERALEPQGGQSGGANRRALAELGQGDALGQGAEPGCWHHHAD